MMRSSPVREKKVKHSRYLPSWDLTEVKKIENQSYVELLSELEKFRQVQS